MKYGLVCSDFFASTVALANALASGGDTADIIIVDKLFRKKHDLEALEIKMNIPPCFMKRIENKKTRGIVHLENQDRVRLFISKMPKNKVGIKSLLNPVTNYLRRKLSLNIRDKGYDLVIVIGQDLYSSYISSDLENLGVNNVHTFHEIIRRFTDRKLFDSVGYIAGRNIPIVVHSKYCQNELKSLIPNINNINFIPFGSFDGYKGFNKRDDKILSVLQCDNKPYILAYGFIKEYKGYDLLYEAYKLIKSNGKMTFKIVVAGNGYVPVLDEMKRNSDFVVINKWISNDETATLFHHCKVVVCPYQSASQSGIPQTAFTFGKPVIANDVGAFGEIINEKNGRLTNSVESLAEAILEFVNIKMEIEFDSFFSWHDIKGKYNKLFKSVALL